MIKAIALSAPASLRAHITILCIGAVASGVVATQARPIASAISGLFTPTMTVVTGKLKAPPVDPTKVQPFYLKADSVTERQRAIRCMTDALYYEAANEPEEGQRAVAQVVVNRVRDEHFPKSVCGVVYQGWERQTGCQFSFVCDGSIRRRPADPVSWSRLRPIAEDALNGYVATEVGASTHYYANYVRPNWIRTVAKVTEIGKHIFCSWKGRAGLPTALRQTYAGGEMAVAQSALDGVRARVVAIASHRERGRRVHSVLRT
jgi:spore germination cell wall hydrolase CwlJ-like protein